MSTLVSSRPIVATPPKVDALPVPTNVKGALRRALLILVLGFGGFLLWAVLVPLDEGVPAPATIVVEARSTQIGHPSGGVVAEVLVTEGQRVAKGDVLVRLSDVNTKAGQDEVRIQWLSAKALEARLLAEQTGAISVSYPTELMAVKDQGLAQQQMKLQTELFVTRQRSLAQDMAVLNQQLTALQATAAGQRKSIMARQEQLALVEQELAGVRQMVQDGFTARTRQTELERQALDARASLADMQGNQARLAESVTEVRARQQQRRQELRKDTETQLTEVRREAGAQGERLKGATEGQDRTIIRAPIAGSVVGLAGTNAGSIVTPGARLMEIVPDQGRLVLEAQIPTHLIDRISPGLPADIHLHAFINLPQLVVPGKVATVSAGSLTDPNTRTSYYLARVEVTPEGIKKLDGRVLQPGMPADVVVKTGERSLLNYLMRPLLKRFSESMKEN